MSRKEERVGEALAMRFRGARRGGQAVEERGAEKFARRAAKGERSQPRNNSEELQATTGVGCDGFHPKVIPDL